MKCHEDDEELSLNKIILFFAIGGFGLWAGSELLIDGSVKL